MDRNFLSKKDIPHKERLIFALDVPSEKEARRIVELLDEEVLFYKLGLELFMAGGYYEFIKWLVSNNKKVFVDLKFFDVAETVGSAVRQLRGRGVTFASVHGGNDDSLKAAVREKDGVKVLAVTVLTSLDDKDMIDLGFRVSIPRLVLSRAKRALEIGCDGVISSGLEASKLRNDLGDQFLIVTPGIRPGANKDDQKRTVNVEEAFLKGADYIVVGRPIKDVPDPKKAAKSIQAKIAKLFA